MSIPIKFCVTLLLLTSTFYVFPQQLRFDQLSIADGLSSNTVYAINQDHQGKLWLGTLDGLNEYDGYKISSYRHDNTVEASLPNNRITLIYEDRQKHLWLYDEYTSTMIKFDPSKKAFKAYYLDKIAPGPLEISRIFEDEEGTVRIHSMHSFILSYSETTDSFSMDNISHHYSHHNFSALYPALIAAFDTHLASTGRNFSSSSISIRKIIQDHTGRYWIATRFDGLYTATVENNEFIFIDHLYTKDKLQFISSEEIHDVYEDHSQVIWICTRNNGVYRYSPHKYKFNLIKSFDSPTGAEALGAVRAIAGDREQNLWIGTNDQGLIHMNLNTRQGKRYLPNNKNPHSLSHRFVRSLWMTADQQLWIGQYQAVSRYQPKQDNFLHFVPSPQHGEEVRIYDFKSDTKRGIWMAGWDLILHFDTEKNTFTYLSKSDNKDGFNNENIRDLELTDDGSLWIAIGEKGVSIRNIHDEKFTTLHYSPTSLSGLPSDNIFDIFKDSKKRFWLATADGLCLFDPVKFTCETFTVNNGLPSNLIYCILEDAAGNLWFSSTRGISRFNPANQSIRTFDVDDGLQSNEFTENAYYKGEDGTMYFGGIDGLNFFHPENVAENKRPPLVSITTLKVFDKPLSEETIYNENALTQRTEEGAIQLTPEQRSVSFEFVAMHYVNPKKNRYAFMLEGFENTWTYRDANARFANYTNLEPGKYTFKVKAANSDGYWSEPIELSIIIDKPVYATLWFKLLVICFLVVASVVGYRMRIAALKRQQGIKAHQLETELNFLKSQVNPHFLFNTLNNIYALCQVNSKNAAPMVGKISEMMRYMLYDCKENRVPLEKEIDYLNNFIELHQLKSSRKLNVLFNVSGNITAIKIAPLLLINFLENSFKHGNLTFSANGFIRCDIEASESELKFRLQNSHQQHQTEQRNIRGIGLENVRHRLDLLYPGKYTLTITDNNSIFGVELIIQDI